jgi:hypothetical protein
LLKMIKPKKAPKRNFLCVGDKVGGHNKTETIKMIEKRVGKNAVISVTFESMRHALHRIAENQDKWKDMRRSIVVVIDIPRGFEWTKELCMLMEKIKDGRFQAPLKKTDGAKDDAVDFGEFPPYLFVFCNDLPPLE